MQRSQQYLSVVVVAARHNAQSYCHERWDVIVIIAGRDVHTAVVLCHRNTAKAAYGAVEIPEGVIDLLTGLRDYLQVIVQGRC